MKNIFSRGLLLIAFVVQILGMNFQSAQAEETKDVSAWTTVVNMNDARSNFTLSLLPDNSVLAAGGENSSGFLKTSEYYDPTKIIYSSENTWTTAGNLNVARANHTATTLLDGRVLIVGGENETGLGEPQILKSAEIYDPLTESWSLANPMLTARIGHTATRLQDGRVLVVGGCSSALNCNSSAEIYNPSSNTWTTITSMNSARKNHAAVLLLDGTVMVTGGYNYGSPLSTYYKSTEIYDPSSNSWTTKDSMLDARSEHFAVVRRDGKVVVAGGVNFKLGNLTILSSAEIYDPVSNTWTSSKPLWFASRDATAILDPYDRFILMGGRDFGTWVDGANYVQSRDIDIDTEDWAPHEFPDFSPARYNHASIQLATGALLTAGGEGRIDGALQFLNSTVIYQDMDGTAYSYPNTLGNGAVFSAGTFLPNGDILITGGTETYSTNFYENNYCTNRAYLWSAKLDDRDDLQPMNVNRCSHTSTLLPDGRVVVIGGTSIAPGGNGTNIVETLTNGVWTKTSTPYWIGGQSATLLSTGEILIISVETQPYGLLYNPDSGVMRQTAGQYTGAYNGHTATLMADGTVLLAGSQSEPGIVEFYDPSSDMFTVLTANPDIYPQHTATLLPDGRVLFTGGFNQSTGAKNDVLIYNPSNNTWPSYANLPTPRRNHSAVLMPDGKVVILGGRETFTGAKDRVDIFDPAMNSWTAAGNMSFSREYPQALLSTQGNIFIFGGYDQYYEPVAAVERFAFDNSPWLGLRISENMWQPVLDKVTVTNASNNFQFTLTGTQLTSDVEACSGQTNQAATNHPLVLAMRIGNGQMKWLNIEDTATDTNYLSKSTNQLLNGPFLVFDFASGSRSEGKIALPTPGSLLSGLSLNPEIVIGGSKGSGTVTLIAPAPTGGTTIALSSDNVTAKVPTPLIIPEGQTSGTFEITTTSVSSNTIVNITAQQSTKAITKQLVVIPSSPTVPILSDLTLSSDTSHGGETITATVSINIPAPSGGTTIAVSSDMNIATVPATVTIPQGQTTAQFSITIADVDKNYLVTITASLNGIEKESQITVYWIKNIFLPLVIK